MQRGCQKCYKNSENNSGNILIRDVELEHSRDTVQFGKGTLVGKWIFDERRHSSMAEVEGVEGLGNKVLESKTGTRSGVRSWATGYLKGQKCGVHSEAGK